LTAAARDDEKPCTPGRKDVPARTKGWDQEAGSRKQEAGSRKKKKGKKEKRKKGKKEKRKKGSELTANLKGPFDSDDHAAVRRAQELPIPGAAQTSAAFWGS
jgi:hypothetical protein